MAQATPGAQSVVDAEKLYDRLGFSPHSQGQEDYLYSETRFNIACCGRRWGKSQTAGHRMTLKSFIPDTYNWIVGPTYKLGEKEFRVVWDDYRKLGLLKECKKGYSVHQGVMYIHTPWGSHVEVVSADKPDSLVGEGLSHVIMSEAAKHSRSIWEQYIEPALSDLRGSADFPSTPQGYNWYHGLYLLGQEHSSGITTNQYSEAYRSWRFPSWENSVRYPGGEQDPEIQRIKHNASPHWFDQEYGASFTTMAGVIYEEFDERVNVINDYVFQPQHENYLSFDYGFANPFVALDIQLLPDGTCIVWREYVSRFISTHEHAQALLNRDNPQGYHVDCLYGDPRGADEAATIAPILGYVVGLDVPWKHGVEQIKRLLKARPTKLLISRACPNLIRSLSQLRVKEQGRQTKFDLQELSNAGTNNIQHKVDDHAADALRYFVGPHIALGAGISFADVYGNTYSGSESQDFFTLHQSLHLNEDGLTLNKNF